MKRHILLAAVLLLTLSLAAGAAEPNHGGTLVAANALTLPHLDPDKTTDSSVGQIMWHVYEGLFELDAEFRPVPHLASGYTVNEEGTRYVITLREGVPFHDGQIMTAHDVEASFHRYLRNNGGGRTMAPFVESAFAEDDSTFVVEFNQPYAPFLFFLSSIVANQKFVVRPASIIEQFGDETITEHVGTGPFQFHSWVPDQYVRMTAFADYAAHSGPSFGYSGAKTAYVDTLEFRIIREQSVRTAGVRTGEYHFADAVSRDQYTLLQNDASLETWVVSPFRQSFLIVNMGHPPFDSLTIRKAMQYAVDPEEMGYAVVGDPNFWELNPSLFPPDHLWHVPDAGAGIYAQPDPERARAYLEQGGYDGTPIIILNSREDEIESRSALTLQSQLEAVGFVVDVRLLDRATVVEQRSLRDGYHVHFSQFITPDPDPQVFQAWMGTNKWIGNWDDEDSRTMDAIFEEMLVTTDMEARRDIVVQWHEAFYRYVPYVKFYNFSQLRLTHESVAGYSNFVHPTFFNVWLEQ